MSTANTVVSIVLALILLGSGGAKLAKVQQVMDILTNVGFPPERAWMLAAAQIAGAVGLVVGLFWSPIGVAAAIGVVLYFLGAVGSHLRVKDTHLEHFAPALVLLLVAIVALVLQISAV